MLLQAYNKRNKQHTVTYDDGDKEQLNLSTERWELQQAQTDMTGKADKPTKADKSAKAGKAHAPADTAKEAGTSADKGKRSAEPEQPQKQKQKKPSARASAAISADEAGPSGQAGEAAAEVQDPTELVHKRVKVWWPDDKAWYSGEVMVREQAFFFFSKAVPVSRTGSNIIMCTIQ